MVESHQSYVVDIQMRTWNKDLYSMFKYRDDDDELNESDITIEI